MKKKIYIVEDNAMNIKLYKAILNGIPNIELFFDENGKTGLEMIKSGDPDIIILDNKLPGMHGSEICKELRKIERFEKIPILAASSSPIQGNREEFFLNAGFTLVISKPLKITEFREKIIQLLD